MPMLDGALELTLVKVRHRYSSCTLTQVGSVSQVRVLSGHHTVYACAPTYTLRLAWRPTTALL
jgi:hypothetical protein